MESIVNRFSAVALVVMYANPDRYPPTINAVNILRAHYHVHVICRLHDAIDYPWPDDVVIERLGTEGSVDDKMAESAVIKLREYLSFRRTVHTRIRELSPVLVYTYEPHAFVASLTIKKPDALLVYHRHEVEEIGKLPCFSLQTWIVHLALRSTKRADILVFPEKNRAAYYATLSRDNRPAFIVPNTPSIYAFPPRGDWSELIADRWTRKQVFFRGYVGPSNGVLEVLDALPHMKQRVTLALIGHITDEFRARIFAITDRDESSQQVRIEGYVPYIIANRETYQASCGFTLPLPVSTNWTYIVSASNKIFEYAACGLPVIVPDRPAYREYFSRESWVHYADPSSPASIAAAIDEVFSDRQLYTAMCHAAREAFETRFHYEIVFQPVLDRIRELLARKGGESTPPPHSDSA